MDAKEKERLYEGMREILKRLCDKQKFHFDCYAHEFEVVWNWAEIWGLLDEVLSPFCIGDEEDGAVVLSWLEQYLEGKMRWEELMRRVREMREKYRRLWEEMEERLERERRKERIKEFLLKPFKLLKRFVARNRLTRPLIRWLYWRSRNRLIGRLIYQVFWDEMLFW